MSVTKKLNQTGLSQVWSKIMSTFVKKEEGMGLSEENFTTDLKTKLDTVSENSEENVIAVVTVNGEATQVTDKTINIDVPTGELADLDSVSKTNLDTSLQEELDGKATKGTTLNEYGITDAYTAEQTDNAIKTAVSKIYKIRGSIAFADLPTEGLVEGDVYNITDEFTASDAFVIGEQDKVFPAGTNVVYTEHGWDCMAGTYDFSVYLREDELVDITEDEINEICVVPEE